MNNDRTVTELFPAAIIMAKSKMKIIKNLVVVIVVFRHKNPCLQSKREHIVDVLFLTL